MNLCYYHEAALIYPMSHIRARVGDSPARAFFEPLVSPLSDKEHYCTILA